MYSLELITQILVACELLYCPFQSIMLWDVGSVAGGGVELRALDVFGNGHENINVVGNASLFVVAFHLDYESDFGV